MIKTILKVGDILKSNFTIMNRQRLYQVTKITDLSIFIKIIGDKNGTYLRFESESDLLNSFKLERYSNPTSTCTCRKRGCESDCICNCHRK